MGTELAGVLHLKENKMCHLEGIFNYNIHPAVITVTYRLLESETSPVSQGHEKFNTPYSAQRLLLNTDNTKE